uniref:Uncharacterized protein n=1 Tax=Trichogramma kaykai TaxID=54128 RepID=A0ABD2XMM9_9HYME
MCNQLKQPVQLVTKEKPGETHFRVASESGCQEMIVESFLQLGQYPKSSQRETDDTPLDLALDNHRSLN